MDIKKEAVSKEAAFFYFQFFGWVYAQFGCIKWGCITGFS